MTLLIYIATAYSNFWLWLNAGVWLVMTMSYVTVILCMAIALIMFVIILSIHWPNNGSIAQWLLQIACIPVAIALIISLFGSIQIYQANFIDCKQTSSVAMVETTPVTLYTEYCRMRDTTADDWGKFVMSSVSTTPSHHIWQEE